MQSTEKRNAAAVIQDDTGECDGSEDTEWNIPYSSVACEHPEAAEVCKLGDDKTISIFKRIIREAIQKVKHTWKRLVSDMPV